MSEPKYDYWHNAKIKHKDLQKRLKDLQSALRSVSQAMLEDILFNGLYPNLTKRTLRSAVDNPVVYMSPGYEYRIDGMVVAGHGRHDRAETLALFLGAPARLKPNHSWHDNPVSESSPVATLHSYGEVGAAVLVDLVSAVPGPSEVAIIACSPEGDERDATDRVAAAIELADLLDALDRFRITLPGQYVNSAADQERLRSREQQLQEAFLARHRKPSSLRRLKSLLTRSHTIGAQGEGSASRVEFG